VSSSRYRSSKKGGHPAMIVIALVLAILAPLLAQGIYLAVSRRREYLADANAAVLTRYPEGLASALEVLGRGTDPIQGASKATAPMYIVNPFKGKTMAAGLGSTHPPIAERVKVLRGMGGTVSYAQYQKSWRSATGKNAGHLPKSALRQGKSEKARAPLSKKSRAQDNKQRLREAGDLLRKVNQFVFLPCACGLQMKLPPDFKKDTVKCPRCSRDLAVPVAQLAAAQVVAGAIADGIGEKTAAVEPSQDTTPHAALEVAKKKGGWMTFKCDCGAAVNLSPSCSVSRVNCSKCGRQIDVTYE
ncbi:M48 family metalloprotease, partial [Candidatus Hydrogenedentota bacterium]